jgi:DNA polymerase (family 10)
MDKDQIAEILTEIGILLDLKGENPFKSRAYGAAARALETMTEPLGKVIADGRLGEVKGIGEAIQKKIVELHTNGKLPYYDELKASIPAGLFALLQIPGLGPKKVKVLYEKLKIESIDQLETACKSCHVAELDGFGEKTQAKILEGIQFRRTYASKHLLCDAVVVAGPILEALRLHEDVIRCSTAGSLRRSKEIIGDIDLLASSKNPARVIDFFAALPDIINVTAKGDTKASVVFQGGIQIDLRVVSDSEFPFALAYFTGSKEHNIVMRQRAIRRDMRLNEYGLFRSKEETRDPKLLVPCRTEEELFQELGLQYIPPELREDQGEFVSAEQGKIPRLIDWTELKGSLHNHSNWSDGRQNLEEIIEYMEGLGCAYWGITDHSKTSVVANGLSPERLRKQIVEIRRLNQQLESEGRTFRLLAGSEVDILPDGQMDFADELLAELDVVIASVHQGFTGSEAETTKRLIRAAQNPFVHIMGHLTGRLLLRREPYKVNQHAVIDACAEAGTWIELNATPDRFDMDWRLWHYAQEKGVKCVINCDAHRNEHAMFLRLGAGLARKGWLARADVMNTLPLDELKRELGKKRTKR